MCVWMHGIEEQMKLPNKYCHVKGVDGGSYSIPFEGRLLLVIASNGQLWEHVSVSLKNRCPNWREMCFVKDFFWEPEEIVMQLHPPKSQHVNMHPYCLHLWRPIGIDIPAPPPILIGFK